MVDRGGRHLFAVPWRDFMLIGVWHKVYTSPPDEIIVETEEIENFVNEVNLAYPGIAIRMDEISMINTGLTLFGEEDRQSEGRMSFGKRSMLIDHESAHGLGGIVTLIGVRATTARGMASKALNLIMKKNNRPGNQPDTENTPVYGGGIESFNQTVKAVMAAHASDLTLNQAQCLVSNYGNQWNSVLKYANEEPLLFKTIGKSTTIKAEILHAVREEMAFHLSDVVFRRTELGTGRLPAAQELEECALQMGNYLSWDSRMIDTEIELTKRSFHIAAVLPN